MGAVALSQWTSIYRSGPWILGDKVFRGGAPLWAASSVWSRAPPLLYWPGLGKCVCVGVLLWMPCLVPEHSFRGGKLQTGEGGAWVSSPPAV